MDFHNMSFGEGLLISAFCTLIVFLVLVCISYLVDITAFLSNRKKKQADELAVTEAAWEQVDDRKTLAIIAAAVASTVGVDLPTFATYSTSWYTATAPQ